MRTIILGHTPLSYELTKSSRKSIAISIKPDASIHVKIPSRISVKEAEAYIRQKETWILSHLEQINEAKSNAPVRKYLTGEYFPYLGREYELVIRTDAAIDPVSRRRTMVYLNENRLLMTVAACDSDSFVAAGAGDFTAGRNADIAGDDAGACDQGGRRSALEYWYRQQAGRVLADKVRYFAQEMDVRYQDIHIKNQKSLWGSCSARGNLNFNWHIVMAPESVVDYLIIHELSHLWHMDHSPAFWAVVARFCPEYQASRKWLRENGNHLKAYL